MKYVIILTLLLNSYSIQAIELDIGIGYTKTEKPPNGRWYQKEFEHNIESSDANYQLGIRFKRNKNHLTIGYKHLGKFSVSSDFIANDENYYDWQEGKDAPPLSHLTGSGKVHGIYIKGERHYKHIFLTLGGWLHKSEWKVRSPEEWDMYRSGDNKGQVYGPFDKTHENKADIAVSWIAGLGVKYKSLSVMAEIWDIENSTKEYPATYLGKSQVITLVYTF